MAQNLKSDFHTSVAQTFVKDIQLIKNTYYSFIGKISKWNDADLPPTSTVDSLEQDIFARDNIVYMSKITPNDVSLCTARHDWTSGTVYDRWESDLNMQSAKFYVVNSSYAVYKCLDNNAGAPSTVEPTGNNYNVTQTADGYVWKYMYTIPAFKRIKFANTSYIPVQKSITDTFYNKGGITDVVINAGGSGYTSVSQTTIAVGGPGTGAVLLPVITSAGSIERVIVLNGGTGYTTVPTLTVSGSGTKLYPETLGSTAVLEAVVSAGVLKSVLVRDPGISYTKNTTTAITITGDGTGAVITPVVYDGQVIDIVIENSGANYSYAKLSVTGTGTGAALTTSFGIGDIVSDQNIVEQLVSPGSIYAIKITEQGAGYTLGTSPAVTIIGDGSGATAEAILTNDKITNIKMTNFGTGYTYADVIIAPSDKIPASGGINAAAKIIKGPLQGHGYDAVAELHGDIVCISTNLTADDILSSINQDYRQYGIIKNPSKSTGTEYATVNKDLLCFKVKTLSMAGLQNDMVLDNGGYRYTVVKFDSTYLYLQPMHMKNTIPLGTMSAVDSVVKINVTEVVSSPMINKYTGNLMFVSSEDSFSFTSEQNIALKTYIKC